MAFAAGCAKRSSTEPGTGPEMMSGAGDELAALEQQLAQREAQLRAVSRRSKAAEEAGSGGRDGGDMKSEAQGAAPTATTRPAEPAHITGSTGATMQSDAEDETPGGGRCEQICEISAAICALEQQICGLAPRHPDDPRYQAACERAAGDCRFATEACHACT